MDKRTGQDLKTPRAQESRPVPKSGDFSAARARAAGASARSAAAVADVDLFGEIRQPPPELRQRPHQGRKARTRPRAAPSGQERLEGALLPFCDPIPARSLARSTPPIIEGIRADIEAQVDEAFQGVSLGGTLADALPCGIDGDLTVVRLIECDIEMRDGPILRQTRPRPDDDELVTTAGFWDFLSQAGVGDRREVDGDTLVVFARGCTVWLPDVRALFWFTLSRHVFDNCQDYFRHQNDILKTVERAERAAAGISNFALRLEDRAEWDRRVDEEAAARAEFHRLLSRFGRHPLYPPHYL